MPVALGGARLKLLNDLGWEDVQKKVQRMKCRT
jgi:hypothetical protein